MTRFAFHGIVALIFMAMMYVSSCSNAQPKNEEIAASCCDGEGVMATCTGSKNCAACKNCKACKHCKKDGGTCGVCK